MTARARKRYSAELAGAVKQWRFEREQQAHEAAVKREALEREISIAKVETEIRQAREFYKIRARWGFELGPGALASLEGSRHGHA